MNLYRIGCSQSFVCEFFTSGFGVVFASNCFNDDRCHNISMEHVCISCIHPNNAMNPQASHRYQSAPTLPDFHCTAHYKHNNETSSHVNEYLHLHKQPSSAQARCLCGNGPFHSPGRHKDFETPAGLLGSFWNLKTGASECAAPQDVDSHAGL